MQLVFLIIFFVLLAANPATVFGWMPAIKAECIPQVDGILNFLLWLLISCAFILVIQGIIAVCSSSKLKTSWVRSREETILFVVMPIATSAASLVVMFFYFYEAWTRWAANITSFKGLCESEPIAYFVLNALGILFCLGGLIKRPSALTESALRALVKLAVIANIIAFTAWWMVYTGIISCCT
jgi:hypothetical protein